MRGWARRRGRLILHHLPPRIGGAVARVGWSLQRRRVTRAAEARDADWDTALLDPPLPPVRLRALVSYPADAKHFLATGEENARYLATVLERAGIGIRGRVLDFGCGCGRIARWLPELGDGAELHGCDPNPELADWCSSHLPELTVARSDERPPAPYPDDHFDLVCAFSIFTHLPVAAQDAWLEELHRILRPGGALIFTVNGALAARALPRREHEAFARGEPVTLFGEAPGSNLCAAYRSTAYVEEHMLRRFDPVLSVPAEEGRTPIVQDTHVARKRARPG